MVDIDYFRKLQGASGLTSRHELTILEARRTLERDLVNSVNYVVGKRNGETQRFVVKPSDVRYKYIIMAFPGEDLFVGDTIECYNLHWLVIETKVASSEVIQTSGMMWVCNHLFRFQNIDTTIYERWGVLDSGVYSTTVTNDDTVRNPDKQFKIYLPYDDATKYIYIDKRLAVDTQYDFNGELILETYRVTGRNKVARSWGNSADLLVLEARSDLYSPSKDNLELMICDYKEGGTFEGQSAQTQQQPQAQIVGAPTVRLGRSRTFTAVFSDASGSPISATPVWSVSEHAGITYQAQEDGSFVVTAENNEQWIGTTFTVTVEAIGAMCEACSIEVEVIGFG